LRASNGKVAAFFSEQIYGHALVRLEIGGASVWSLSAPHGAVNLPRAEEPHYAASPSALIAANPPAPHFPRPPLAGSGKEV
jgi:hypothetical protein